MIALALTDVKECMGKLLLSETFDPFYFIEGEIVTFNTFTMDGFLKKDFFEEELPRWEGDTHRFLQKSF